MSLQLFLAEEVLNQGRGSCFLQTCQLAKIVSLPDQAIGSPGQWQSSYCSHTNVDAHQLTSHY